MTSLRGPRGRRAVVRMAGALLLAVVLAGALLVSAGCGGDDALIGTWVSSDTGDSVQIGADTLSVEVGGMSIDFTYEVDGKNLVLTSGDTDEMIVPYTVTGDTLVLTLQGAPMEFTRR